MKTHLSAVATALIIVGVAGSADAQPRRDNDRRDNGLHEQRADNRAARHDWRKGGRIDRSDWNRGRRVDYRQRHLNTPPRGYEWREVDGNLVLAAAATGIIASIIAAAR